MVFLASISQILTVLSNPPVTTCLPSGAKTAASIWPVWPTKEAISFPVFLSHSLAIESPDPVRIDAPSGENAKAFTPGLGRRSVSP